METTNACTLYLADRADVLEFKQNGQLMELLQPVFGAVMYQFQGRLKREQLVETGQVTRQIYELEFSDWIEAQRLAQYLDKLKESTFSILFQPNKPLANLLAWDAHLVLELSQNKDSHSCILVAEESPIKALSQVAYAWQGLLPKATMNITSASGAFGQAVILTGGDMYHVDAAFFGMEWLPILNRTSSSIQVWIPPGAAARKQLLLRNQAGQAFTTQYYERH